MPIEPFDFTYTLTSQASENEVLNALGKTRVKEFEPKSYFFTESSLPAQTSSTGAYGPDGSTKFNITTQFDLVGKKAYAVTSGQVLIVPQTGSTDKVNVFIKPLKHVDIGVPIKYYVYRGLKKASFIDATNNILTKDTTNSPFMAKVWEDLIHFNDLKVPYPVIPATLFGYNTTDSNNTRLDAKFFNVVDDTTTEDHKIYNLANIEAGQHFGEFADNTGGFEIVLNDGFYYQEKSDTGFEFDMVYAKSAKVSLDIANIAAEPTISEKIYRENVQKFLDPAAFYGAHITEKGKGEIKVIDTSAKYSSKEAIFTNIVSKFYNKHKCYLYIQCNRGRSFNFDKALGTEPLKIGVSETVLPSLYQTNGWPILINEFEQTHAADENDNKKSINNLSFQLKFKTVNKNVTLYNTYGNCANETIEGNFLGSKALVDEANIATQEYTNKVNYKLINNYNLGSTSLTTKSIASFIYINHEEKEVEYFNDFFGPIQIDHLMKSNDQLSQKKAKKSSSEKHRIKNSTIDNKSSVSKFSFTTIPYLNSSNDDLYRLYTLKRIGSEDSTDRTFRENSSSDFIFAEINSTDDYGQFQYRDKNYKVWKGQITDEAETINTLQLINFEGEGNVTNFMHLGLMNDDYNKVIYDSLTSNTTNHIPDSKANVYFHLEETVTTVPSSLFKKYILGVKVETFLGLSYEIIYPSSENTVYVYTVDGHYFFTKEFSEKFQYVEEFGDATITFRPKSDYVGEFGFDWMRLNESLESNYEDSILGGYVDPEWIWNEMLEKKYGFDSKEEAFQALKKEYISIATNNKELYYIPYLNIYSESASGTFFFSPHEVNLKTTIAIHKNLTKLELDYDTSLFTVTAQFPTDLNVGPKSFDVQIKCHSEFNTDKYIKIMAHSQQIGELPKVKLAGIIKVCKNSIENIKKIKIVLFKAETNIDNDLNTIEKGSFSDQEINTLKRALYQAHIYADIMGPLTLNLKDNLKFKKGDYFNSFGKIYPVVGSDSDKKQDDLKDAIDEQFQLKDKKYFRVIAFSQGTTDDDNERGITEGNVQAIGKHSVCLYGGNVPRDNYSMAHEVCHGLGLRHTFKDEAEIYDSNQKYVYPLYNANTTKPPVHINDATNNLMSYSPDKRSLWHWQWKIMCNNIKNYINEE